MHVDGGFPDLFPGDIQIVFFVVLFWWEWAKKGGDAYYVNLSMSSMSSIYPSMSH